MQLFLGPYYHQQLGHRQPVITSNPVANKVSGLLRPETRVIRPLQWQNPPTFFPKASRKPALSQADKRHQLPGGCVTAPEFRRDRSEPSKHGEMLSAIPLPALSMTKAPAACKNAARAPKYQEAFIGQSLRGRAPRREHGESGNLQSAGKGGATPIYPGSCGHGGTFPYRARVPL